MNIVVYGCDNSGKTSLANHIADKFKFEYVRSKGGPKMDLIEVLKYIHKNLYEGYINKVFDRFTPIEEFANGIALRNENRIATSFIDTTDFLNGVGLFIYARPDMETVKNFGEREQMDGIISHIDQLRNLYDFYTVDKIETVRPRYMFDWTKDPSYEKIDKFLEMWIENDANITKAFCKSACSEEDKK